MTPRVAFALAFAGLASSGAAGQAPAAPQATPRPTAVQAAPTPVAPPAPTSGSAPIPASNASAPSARPADGGPTAPAVSVDAAGASRAGRRSPAPVAPTAT